MLVGTWTDAAAIATFITVAGGGTYAVVKWLRNALRNEIREVTEPMFKALSDETKQSRGATEALGRDVRGHMGREDQSDTRQLVDEWGERLSREIGQMRWRAGDPPQIAESDER